MGIIIIVTAADWRALTGNFAGAIEDFQAFVDATDDEDAKAQRQQWIEALQNGENPLTPEVLEQLRIEN
jgi:hypothetical protein